MCCDDQVIHTSALGFYSQACFHSEAQKDCFVGEETSRHTQLHLVLLVLLTTKA